MTEKRKKSRGQTGLRNITMALTAWAIIQELRKPANERTWNGTVAGFVPYDFRMPTPERIKQRMWSPDNPHVVNPQVFGVGWTLNAGRLVKLAKQRFSEN